MPRRRPPVEIFTAPVPEELQKTTARCPMCAGNAEPYGYVVEKVVYRCMDCGIRFKGNGHAGVVSRERGQDRP